MGDNNDTGDTTYPPRLAWNHQLNPNSALRFSYAEATRSPFIFEEYTNYYVPDFAGLLGGAVWTDLSDLEPEEIKSFDIGYIALLNNKNTELDIRLYKNKLSNLIVLDWDVGEGFIQGDGFNVTGLEASVSHKFDNTKIMLNYARTKIYADNLVFADASWLETGAPEDNLSLLAMHDFKNGYKGSLGYYYTGTYQQLCCEEDYQSPRKRLDLTLSRHFKLGEYNSNIKLVLQNVTNEEVETKLLNNYDRQGYISLNVEL
jgi:outer membrane receptor protein involved in Fe transport